MSRMSGTGPIRTLLLSSAALLAASCMDEDDDPPDLEREQERRERAAELAESAAAAAARLAGLADDGETRRSKTWTWGGDADGGTTYRYTVNRSPTHEFTNEPWSDARSVVHRRGSGAYYLHVEARDSGGGVAKRTVSMDLDTKGPAIAGVSRGAAPLRSKTWTWTYDDPGTEHRHAVNTDPDFAFTTEPWTAGTSGTAEQPSGDGMHYLHVEARDALGNVDRRVFDQLLDNTAPTVTGLADDAAPTNSKTWTWGADEEASYRFAVNGSAVHAFASEPYGSAATATASSGNGTVYLHVQARDAAGNVSGVTTVRAVMDTVPPAAPSGVALVTSSPSSVRAPRVTVDGLVVGNTVRVFKDQACSDPVTGEAPVTAASQTVTTDTIPEDGSHVFRAAQTDPAGNRSPCSSAASAAFVLDGPPVVTGLADETEPVHFKRWSWSSPETATYRHAVTSAATHAFGAGDAYGSVDSVTRTSNDGTGAFYVHVQARDSGGLESAVVSHGATFMTLEEFRGATLFKGRVVAVDAGPVFADMGGDGDQDLVVGGRGGRIQFFENMGGGVFRERVGAANPFGSVAMDGTSRPALADLDDDGDLDLLVLDSYGGSAYLENTGTASSPSYADRTGRASDPFREFYFGLGASPAFGDLDSDDDVDLVVGTADGKMLYFENMGSGDSPSFESQDGTGGVNPFGSAYFGVNAVPTIVPVDGDSSPDLVVGSDDGVIRYYNNEDMSFGEMFDDDNPLDGMKAVSNASPTFGDHDGDGDVDVVIGGHHGTLKLYENDDGDYEELEERVSPFHGASSGRSSAPALADVDQDGDVDLVVGNYLGAFDFFENTGDGAFVNRSSTTADPFRALRAQSGFSEPTFVDLDGDSKRDLVSGLFLDARSQDGRLHYYRNETVDPAQGVVYTEKIGSDSPLVDVMIALGYSDPGFGDVDGDNDLDLIVGREDGAVDYHQLTSPQTYTRGTGADNPFDSVDVPGHAAPELFHLDGDNVLDLVVGGEDGGLRLFQRTGANPLAYSETTGAGNPLGHIEVPSLSTPYPADVDGDGDVDLAIGEGGGFVYYALNFDGGTTFILFH